MNQFIPSEFCLKCQGCCRFARQDSVWAPSVSSAEAEGLFNNNVPPSAITRDNKIRVFLYGENSFICGFLSPGDNKCKIYSQRPRECRIYPFLINRAEGNVFLALDLKCPYVENNFEEPGFKKHILQAVEFISCPEELKVLKGNPQLIQEYPGVLNLKELAV